MKLRLNLSSFLVILAALLPLAIRADAPGQHPHYLRALTDLRDARWSLEHRPGDAAVAAHENIAIEEIDRAIGELRVAAVEDGKNVASRPHEDANLDRSGRLQRALELIRRAHSDVSMQEDSREAREMQKRALRHIEIALHETERALVDVHHDR
jgi:hypothetical protein